MAKRALRELLNRLRWDARAGGEGIVLRVRVRAAGEEVVEEVPFAAISAILPGGIEVADGTFLPYHRVCEVRKGRDVLWQPRAEREGS